MRGKILRHLEQEMGSICKTNLREFNGMSVGSCDLPLDDSPKYHSNNNSLESTRAWYVKSFYKTCSRCVLFGRCILLVNGRVLP